MAHVTGPRRRDRLDAVPSRLDLVRGDITALDVDAIVNAANSTLLGGGGVDGAIHRAAGPGLLEECRTLGGCPVGEARITAGHRLRARWVIHTVGPVWRGGGLGEPELLASCYRESLRLAREHACSRLAFPAISCGIYGYPVPEACAIAARETRTFLATHDLPERVTFVAFGEDVWEAFRAFPDFS
jgi:O-acetyl-ADP-ribose deacetylase (regulator of RNase III)